MVTVFVFLVVGLAANYAAAAVLPPLGLPEALEAAAIRAPAAPSQVIHPMDASAGHAMWDPTGHGCIDGGGWDDPFPTGKGTRAPVFCVPQPCARALTPEELSRDVVGRPLRADEWNRYVLRYMRACQEYSMPSVPPDIELLLSSLGAMVDECAPIGSSPTTLLSSAAGRLVSGRALLSDYQIIPRGIRTCSTDTSGRRPPRDLWPEPPDAGFGKVAPPFHGIGDPGSPPAIHVEPPLAAPLPPALSLLIAALIAPFALRHFRPLRGARDASTSSLRSRRSSGSASERIRVDQKAAKRRRRTRRPAPSLSAAQ